MNRFLYAEANPWTLIDPSGHAACGPDGIYCTTSTSAALQCGQGSTCAAQPTHPAEHWGTSPSSNAKPNAAGSPPQATPETAFADQDTWGEDRAIAYASAAGTSAQSSVHCTTINRSGPFCQTAQQQADAAATTAGIGDALGKVWDGFWQTGQCASSVGTQCADLVVGLSQLTADPVGTMAAIADERLTALQSGDKRAGAEAITSTAVDLFGLAAVGAGGALSRAGQAARAADASGEGILFRLSGGRARSMGQSWTPVDPRAMVNARGFLGLPKVNTAEFLTKARVIDWDGISCRIALPCDGNPGGAIEWRVPNPERQLQVLETWPN